MHVFALRNGLVGDYADCIQSFINISDRHIRERVEHELDEGLLWPDPLLQLNPNFEPGPRIDNLVDDGTLHTLCRHVFRIKPTGERDKPMTLHKHQADAIEAARSGDNYVLTTGTGSGKSLAYIIPIVKRRDEAAHGEYRTKRVILEIYDDMQRAIETGQPCQTRLDPPPADPRVAHAERI